MYPKMKRKVAKAGRLRLSPNEEAQVLKEEYERRRKLRLQQVREQERNIALQIRQDVKQRRDEQLYLLAEELKTEWRKEQDEKIQALEKLYLSSLREIGGGHREAKENEPDLEALARQEKERKQRAEQRHKEALKKQKNQNEKLLREQTWRANARKHALDVERDRAAKIASLPPPPPDPFENIELKSAPIVKVCDVETFSISHHHIFEPYVDRESETEQPDVRILAEEEAKRETGLQNEKERERREQLEKARLRGKHALKMVHLAQDREKLLRELEHMQNMDLARRRQIVAQMPPQLFEPAYRRMEIRDDWQRDLECAFEDMYTGERKMKGDLILHLSPQPLPSVLDQSQDELEVTQEQESVSEVPPRAGEDMKGSEPGNELEKTPPPQSKLALKKLLNKIRNQKDHWTLRSETQTASEIGTIESGTISGTEGPGSETDHETKHDPVPEVKELPELLDQTVIAGNGILNHQEEAIKLREEGEKQKQVEWLEQQKKQQLALLQQIEEQKIRLEVDLLKAQMQHEEQEIQKEQECQSEQTDEGVSGVQHPKKVEFQNVAATRPQAVDSDTEDNNLQMIHDYQQRLLKQNRLHKELIEEARKYLHEYQNKLKQRHQSISAAFDHRPVSQNSVPEPHFQLQTTKLRTSQPSKSIFVEKQDEHSKLSQVSEVTSKQENKERFDVDSGGHLHIPDSQAHHRAFQMIEPSSSHQKTSEETLPTQSLGTSSQLHNGSLTTQSSVSLSDNSSQPSGVPLSDESASQASLADQVVLPASLKHQYRRVEGEIRTTCDQTIFSPLHPISSLPCFVANKAERTQESLTTIQNGKGSLPSVSDVVELRDRMLASSESIQAQQEHLRELQAKLDEQREGLLSRQKMQEDLLLQKHAQLKQQMEQHQEALRAFLKRTGQDNRWREMMQTQESNVDLLATVSKEAKDSNWEKLPSDDRSSPAENAVLFQSISSSQQIESSQDHWKRESKWKLSKPPLSKVKLALDMDQHELSVIPELDTPRSGRLSATGYRESFTGDPYLATSVGKLQTRESPNESFHEETDILRITVDASRSSSRESQDQLNGSFSKKLVVETDGLEHSVFFRQLPVSTQDLPSSTDVRGIATDPDHSFRPKSPEALSTAWSVGLLNFQTSRQQVAWGYFSASEFSPTSSPTKSNPDRITEPHPASEEPKYFSCPMKEKANSAWASSAFLLHKQDDHLDTSLSFGEMLHSDGSNIQQKIDKHTQDFSVSSLSNLSSQGDELDAADLERAFPNFHRELFQPLKPSSDLDVLSLSQSESSQHNKDMSKSSNISENHELTSSSVQEISNSLSFFSTGKLSNTLSMEQSSEEVKKQTQVTQSGAEEMLEGLPTESTLQELRLYADEPGNFGTGSGQNHEVRCVGNDVHISPETVQCENLEDNEENITLCSSIENFRSLSLSPVEDQSLFFKLIPENDTLRRSFETTQSVKGRVQFSKENLFVELPTSANKKCGTVTEDVVMQLDLETDLTKSSSYIMRDQSSLSTGKILHLPQENSSQTSNSYVQYPIPESGCGPDTFQKVNLNTVQAEKSDVSLSVSIPVWETYSGCGIMEEPELTLISSNDISTAESDLELLSQATSEKKKTESWLRSSRSEKSNFLPLNLEVDDSNPTQLTFSAASQNFQKDLNENSRSTAPLPELTPVPGSLQELFLKRKKDFIERSSKRVEKIKNKERSVEKKTPQQKKAQFQKPPGAAANKSNKMEDAKMCFADDRKATEVRMYERTSRLYNNLAEVKIRKEEKERRENYAKNRERAKEFQKKTLEKLRARRATVKHQSSA